MRNNKKARILKLNRHSPDAELDFELAYQASLSVQERFRMMIKRSRQIARMLLDNGHIKPFEIIKRS